MAVQSGGWAGACTRSSARPRSGSRRAKPVCRERLLIATPSFRPSACSADILRLTSLPQALPAEATLLCEAQALLSELLGDDKLPSWRLAPRPTTRTKPR